MSKYTDGYATSLFSYENILPHRLSVGELLAVGSAKLVADGMSEYSTLFHNGVVCGTPWFCAVIFWQTQVDDRAILIGCCIVGSQGS